MVKKLPRQFSPHVYQEWGELFNHISDHQKAEILMAITMFPNYQPKDNPVWGFIKSQIEREFETFNERCKKNGEISRDYWNRMKSNDTERIPNDTERHPEQEQELEHKQELKENFIKEKSKKIIVKKDSFFLDQSMDDYKDLLENKTDDFCLRVWQWIFDHFEGKKIDVDFIRSIIRRFDKNETES